MVLRVFDHLFVIPHSLIQHLVVKFIRHGFQNIASS